jgi:hypothetical protein
VSTCSLTFSFPSPPVPRLVNGSKPSLMDDNNTNGLDQRVDQQTGTGGRGRQPHEGRQQRGTGLLPFRLFSDQTDRALVALAFSAFTGRRPLRRPLSRSKRSPEGVLLGSIFYAVHAASLPSKDIRCVPRYKRVLENALLCACPNHNYSSKHGIRHVSSPDAFVTAPTPKGHPPCWTDRSPFSLCARPLTP